MTASGRSAVWLVMLAIVVQVPGLPALCAPQQLLFTADDEGGLVALTDWIPTDELFAAAGVPSPG